MACVSLLHIWKRLNIIIMGVACVSPLTPHPKLNQLPLRKIWLIIIIIFLDLSKNDLERFNDKTTNSGTTSLEENFGGRNLGGSGRGGRK